MIFPWILLANRSKPLVWVGIWFCGGHVWFKHVKPRFRELPSMFCWNNEWKFDHQIPYLTPNNRKKTWQDLPIGMIHPRDLQHDSWISPIQVAGEMKMKCRVSMVLHGKKRSTRNSFVSFTCEFVKRHQSRPACQFQLLPPVGIMIYGGSCWPKFKEISS